MRGLERHRHGGQGSRNPWRRDGIDSATRGFSRQPIGAGNSVTRWPRPCLGVPSRSRQDLWFNVRTFFVGLYCHCNPSRYGLIGAKLTWARPLRLHPPALPSLRQRSPVRPSLTSPPFHSLALQRATLKDASRREERWPRGPSLTAARCNAPGVGRSGRRDGPSVEQRDGWTDRPR